MHFRSSTVASATAAAASSGLAMLVLTCLPVSLEAQHEDAPYAGEQVRAIKALSAEAVDGLLAGEGMGYALAAELHGYPGPRHVLELGEELGLSAEQRRRVEEVRSRMREASVDLGERLVAAERALDRAFASGEATDEEVERLTGASAAIEGRLRAVHLDAHLDTRALLTERQVASYGRLRGYGHDHDPGERHP